MPIDTVWVRTLAVVCGMLACGTFALCAAAVRAYRTDARGEVPGEAWSSALGGMALEWTGVYLWMVA